MADNKLYGKLRGELTEATRFVHIVGIGKHPACLARQLKIGDQLVFDRGVKRTLLDKQEISPSFLALHVAIGRDTELLKVRKDKLIGVVRKQMPRAI